MLRRFALITLLIMPLAAAHADDATTPAESSTPSNWQQTDTATGSNPATLNALQPAGADSSSLQDTSNSSVSPLQSMNSSNLSGSTDAAQALQQINTSNAAKLLVSGEADQPHSLNSGPNVAWLGYLLLALLAATALTAIVWVIERFRP